MSPAPSGALAKIYLDRDLLAQVHRFIEPLLHRSLPSLLLIEHFHVSAEHLAAADQKIYEGVVCIGNRTNTYETKGGIAGTDEDIRSGYGW